MPRIHIRVIDSSSVNNMAAPSKRGSRSSSRQKIPSNVQSIVTFMKRDESKDVDRMCRSIIGDIIESSVSTIERKRKHSFTDLLIVPLRLAC